MHDKTIVGYKRVACLLRFQYFPSHVTPTHKYFPTHSTSTFQVLYHGTKTFQIGSITFQLAVPKLSNSQYQHFPSNISRYQNSPDRFHHFPTRSTKTFQVMHHGTKTFQIGSITFHFPTHSAKTFQLTVPKLSNFYAGFYTEVSTEQSGNYSIVQKGAKNV